MKKLFVWIVSASLFSFASCGGGDDSAEVLDIPDSVKMGGSPMLEIGQEVIDGLVENVSSPVEMAALIKRAGVPFSKDYLSDPDVVDDYVTTYQKALSLGVLGADLGYMNIYDKTGLIMNHLTSIKKIADDLKIGQFFDFSTLKRLATNNENLDTLMRISTSSFNKMDRYLRESNRSSTSALLVTGVWIEGLYLATQVAKKSSLPQIEDRIGEQKISLNDLLIVLKVYKSDKNFATLIKDFEEIKKVFDEVKISVEKGEPSMEERDGVLMIIQNDIQHVEMPEGHINKIIEVTERVRNKIVNAQ